MASTFPLISCICVTRSKPDLLQRAIACFDAQTYPNKQLLVIYESDDAFTKQALKAFFLPPSVKVVEMSATPKQTLGYLRNYAVKLAEGELICQWDDDDWYHCNRLAHQYKVLSDADFSRSGCIMNRWIVFDEVFKKSYLSNSRLWEGSILCRRETLLQHAYMDVSRGEDTDMIYDLFDQNHLVPFANRANLYIYVYHGLNSWDREHWEQIFKAGTPLEEPINEIIIKILRQEYSVGAGSQLLDKYLLSESVSQAV